MLRVVLIAAAAVLAVAAFLVLRPGETETDAGDPAPAATGVAEPPELEAVTPATVEEPAETAVAVDVVGGRPEGGIVRATVERDETVVLVVAADAGDRVHVHGYDLTADVAPGRPARIRFVADAPGRFEVELEDSSVPIAELTVE